MNELKKQNHQWIVMRCPTNVEDLTHVPGIYIQSHSDYLSPCKNNVDEKPVQSVHYLTLPLICYSDHLMMPWEQRADLLRVPPLVPVPDHFLAVVVYSGKETQGSLLQ